MPFGQFEFLAVRIPDHALKPIPSERCSNQRMNDTPSFSRMVQSSAKITGVRCHSERLLASLVLGALSRSCLF